MTLEFLNKEIIGAMKVGDTLTRDVLRSVVGNIKKIAIDKKTKDNITETLVDEVLLKEKKVLQEMIDTCPKDRIETLDLYKAKMQVLEHYVPKLITDEEEIRQLVINICKGQVFTNKGLMMKTVMPQLKGKVDMKLANKVINEMDGKKYD